MMSTRTVEKDVLVKMCATLNEVISKRVAPERFGSHLQSAGFISDPEDYTSVEGHSKYQKISGMMFAVSDHITSFGGKHPERVTAKFNQFILLLNDEMGLTDLAEQLADKCSELSPRYKSPLSGDLYPSTPPPREVKVETSGASVSNGNSQSVTRVTLPELLDYVGVSESKLKERCSDEHLREIAKKVDNWEIYAPYLGLQASDIEDLKEEFRRPELRSFNAFLRWRQRAAFKATYHHLVESVFLKYGNATLAEFVCNCLK